MKAAVLALVLAATSLHAQVSIAHPTGTPTSAQQKRIDKGFAILKAKRKARLRAQQEENKASIDLGSVIREVHDELDLSDDWLFNPSFGDEKSSDYHVKKFVYRPAPPSTPLAPVTVTTLPATPAESKPTPPPFKPSVPVTPPPPAKPAATASKPTQTSPPPPHK